MYRHDIKVAPPSRLRVPAPSRCRNHRCKPAARHNPLATENLQNPRNITFYALKPLATMQTNHPQRQSTAGAPVCIPLCAFAWRFVLYPENRTTRNPDNCSKNRVITLFTFLHIETATPFRSDTSPRSDLFAAIGPRQASIKKRQTGPRGRRWRLDHGEAFG